MSLFSKKPKSIADFEKEIEKLRHKKKLSARNSERLEEYEKQLSSLKTAEESTAKENCHWLYRSFSGAHHLYYHSRMYF